jgi:hypothetical protein
VVEFSRPLRKEASKRKERRLSMLKVVTGVGKTKSKTTTLHPKLSTSISTLYFPPKKPKTKKGKKKKSIPS